MQQFKANSFYVEAVANLQNLTDEKEILTRDKTLQFERELEEHIKNKELININLNGLVRKGKSTTAFALASQKIWPLLKKYGYVQKDDKFCSRNIARDQQEYNRIMTNPDTKFTIICIDEINDLEKTGENTTTEQALFETFSKVQAARYVHHISCSPKEITDPNADILLEVVACDRIHKINHCKLYYRFIHGGNEHIQPLGYVNVDVAPVIKNWLEIEGVFLQKDKSKKDEERIRKMSESDWYVDYMIKKHEKMELITIHGIMQPRKLEYAEMCLAIVEQLKDLSRLGDRVVGKDTIKNFVRAQAREHRIPQSIIGEQIATDSIMGILSLYRTLEKIGIELSRVEKKFNMNALDSLQYERQRDMLQKTQHDIIQAIKTQKDELHLYAEVKKKYDTWETKRK